MKFILDMHLHSSHSRATSRDLTPENLHRWAALKGLTVIGTGDFTHPAWIQELKDKLEPAEDGLYRLKSREREAVERDLPGSCRREVRFLLSVEISSIYKKNGRTRKIHNLVLMPDFQAVERLSRKLGEIGNLGSDGRPILGLDSRPLLEMALAACPEALFVPAHIWTPHFSLFGAHSGFDSIEECFEDLSPWVFAVETGLSSDPPMNWRLSALDRLAIVSSSDAHSPQKLAREATCFDTELSFPAIRSALRDRDPERFLGTLEFYPEEGKYHLDGHRACGVRWKPDETRTHEGICSVCGRSITIGVLHRVEQLADRPEGARPGSARPYESLVPLTEIIASSRGVGPASQKVMTTYASLIRALGPELELLREIPIREVERCGESLVAEGIRRMRSGEVEIAPGFDGEYGRIRVFREGEREHFVGQSSIFGARPRGNGRISGDPSHLTRGKKPPQKRQEQASQLKGIKKKAGKIESNPAIRDPVLLFDAPSPVREHPGTAAPTPEQLAAITAESGPVVVVAGPGTGKTFVLAHRWAWLVREAGVSAESIVAVTFTNRAAGEMLHRLQAMLPKKGGPGGYRVGTFHRLAMDLLRKYRPAEERPVIDEVESRSLVQEIIREGRLKVRLGDACDGISRAKSGSSLREAFRGSPEIGSILREYQKRLRMLRVRDYDDILLDTVAMLESDAALLEEVRREIRHLLVDEFQDVNAVQYRFVRLLAGEGKNLFVIGDPDQAIYGFRGADRRFFRQLVEGFPSARRFRLETNRRSTGAILVTAQAVLGPETDRKERPLRTLREAGVRVRLLTAGSELAEGIAISREVVRQVGGTDLLGAFRTSGPGRSFGDIAVLFRTGRQADVIEDCLRKAGIPCRIVGQKGFMDAGPVRETLAFVRCALDPRDEHRMRSVLRLPRYDPGAEILEAIRARQGRGEGVLYEVVTRLSLELGEGVCPQISDLVSAIEVYGPRLRSESPEPVVRAWCEENGLAGDPEVQHLLGACERHETIASWMGEVLFGKEADCERGGGPSHDPGEAVTLMTLHASKGLEFPVVIIAGAEEGLIPFQERDADLSEERRLLYVGITRARDEVIFTAARHRVRYGREPTGGVSPFIRDLCGALVDTEKGERPRDRAAQLSLF